MIPIGDKPILWHLIRYYSQFGHKDFVLCLGYKANVVKEFSLNYRPQVYADCVVSGFGDNVEILGDPQQDWRIAMIDTGIWRNIGQRLWAVREHVAGEEMFFANYSDGLCDVNLDEMTRISARAARSAASLPSGRHSVCISSTCGRTERSSEFAPARMPTSGSTAVSSSSGRRSSTTCARAMSWSKRPSND